MINQFWSSFWCPQTPKTPSNSPWQTFHVHKRYRAMAVAISRYYRCWQLISCSIKFPSMPTQHWLTWSSKLMSTQHTKDRKLSYYEGLHAFVSTNLLITEMAFGRSAEPFSAFVLCKAAPGCSITCSWRTQKVDASLFIDVRGEVNQLIYQISNYSFSKFHAVLFCV